jgi:glycerophosphoryl diester phosphodiesterase
MIIISHRGYWLTATEKNTEVAFRRSFDLNFGTETDVRDLNGKLVISHDMASGDAMSLDYFLEILDKRPLPLAINIKSDGISEILNKTMAAHDTVDWFVFDMSVPDMRSHLAIGNPVFTRMSEVEQNPVWLERASGVWLDSFNSEWYNMDQIVSLLANGKRVCVVSPELHGRNHLELWNELLKISNHKELLLCTDLPEEARDFFGGYND